MGPDGDAINDDGLTVTFQSTGPVWDPTRNCFGEFGHRYISIHGSRVGPDPSVMVFIPAFTWISIHGSRVGPDV